VRKSRGTTEADGEGPVFGEFVEPAQLAPAEIRAEFVGAGEPDLITRLPVGAEFAGEGEEDAEVLFAEAADRDAGRARVVAEQEDGLTDDRAAGGVAFFGGCLDAGRAGGGAALVAAAELGATIDAVVSRGGRPDLAGPDLPRVVAPTLLIVGEQDEAVLELNQAAYNRLQCEKHLAIVPRATHLFEEEGALENVASLAAAWFRRHLQAK